jgi:hypothetical protein
MKCCWRDGEPNSNMHIGYDSISYKVSEESSMPNIATS